MDVDDGSNEVTLRTYERTAELYASGLSARVAEPLVAFMDAFLALLGHEPTVLEIGSGTGRDAVLLEARGARVVRTDATESFVRHLRAAGHEAAILNVVKDDLGGPYDGVYANAVFLHLPRERLPQVLARVHGAVRAGGGLAFTLKVGEGDNWSDDRLGSPRFFAYWSADAVRCLVDESPWRLVEVREVPGETADWLHVLCART